MLQCIVRFTLGTVMYHGVTSTLYTRTRIDCNVVRGFSLHKGWYVP